jgi:two-component system response regulator GlrR
MAKILILDAEPVVRSVVSTILRDAGYVLQEAETIQDALDRLEKFHPDLLLTNVYLPGITGHDAMKLLRANSPDVPVLMVSGLPDSEVISHWASQSGFDVFPKPFTANALLKKVEDTLKIPTEKIHSSSGG